MAWFQQMVYCVLGAWEAGSHASIRRLDAMYYILARQLVVLEPGSKRECLVPSPSGPIRNGPTIGFFSFFYYDIIQMFQFPPVPYPDLQLSLTCTGRARCSLILSM